MDEHIIDMVRSSSNPKRLANHALLEALVDIRRASYHLIQTLLSCGAQLTARCNDIFNSDMISPTTSVLDGLAEPLIVGNCWMAVDIEYDNTCLLVKQFLDRHLLYGKPESNRSCILWTTDSDEPILDRFLMLGYGDWYMTGLQRKDDYTTWTLFCSPTYLVRLLRLKISANNNTANDIGQISNPDPTADKLEVFQRIGAVNPAIHTLEADPEGLRKHIHRQLVSHVSVPGRPPETESVRGFNMFYDGDESDEDLAAIGQWIRQLADFGIQYSRK